MEDYDIIYKKVERDLVKLVQGNLFKKIDPGLFVEIDEIIDTYIYDIGYRRVGDNIRWEIIFRDFNKEN